MRRAGGFFVAGFLCVGLVQAVTGFIPSVPTATNIGKPVEKADASGFGKFTGTNAPIKKGSVGNDRYEELINKWGNKCKALTPALLAAQLHQESMGFKQSVIDGRLDSPAGAKGIAQFIPGTWASHGIDANKDGKRNIHDPEDAIPSAAKYDCDLATYVKGVPGDSRSNMLASYNAGAGAVQKYNGIPPYRETRDYVRIIKNKAGRFEQ